MRTVRRMCDSFGRRGLALAWLAALGATGCVAVIDANGYEVDPVADDRDLDFVFNFRAPGETVPHHPSSPMDVALVNQDNLLRARARIILSPELGADYEPEELVMKDALRAGETYRVLFFIDSFAEDGVVGNYRVDGNENEIIEHVWIEDVDDDGTGSFVHSTDFVFFTEKDYTRNNDVALLLPSLADSATSEQRRALSECIQSKLGEVFEVRVRSTEGRDIGLFRRYRGTPLPTGSVRLNGIIDAGATYDLIVSVDGKETKSSFQAPDETTLAMTNRTMQLPFVRWAPRSTATCVR